MNLKFAGSGISTVSETLAPIRPGRVAAPRDRHRMLSAVAKVIVILLSCVVDELVFSVPVIAAATLVGPGVTFLMLTPVYFALAVALGLAVSRLRTRRGAASGSRLQRWLDAKTARAQSSWERRALAGFGVLGTGVVTIALGPVLTPWLTHRLGLARQQRLLLAGSAFWSLCLVGTYTGLVALII